MTFETYEGLLFLAIVILGGLGGIALQMRNRLLGFGLLIAIAVILPLEFQSPWGTVLSLPFFIAAFLCASWATTILFGKAARALDPSPAVVASLVFAAVVLVAFVAGQYPWFPASPAPLGAQIAGLGLFLFSIGLFLAVGHQIKSLDQLRRITWLFLSTGAVISITSALVPEGTWVQWGRIQSTVGSVFWTWFVAISFSQALLNRRLSSSAKFLLYGLTVISLYRCFFQSFSWVSGWLPPMLAVGIILYFRLPRLATGLLLLAVSLGAYLAIGLWDKLMVHEQYSYLTRLEAWRVLWQIIERSPIIGSGPANYYHYTPLFPILGWYVHFNSHNNYADLLAQTGGLGLLAFLWFAYEMFRMAFRIRLKMPEGFARAYVTGALGGFAATLVSGFLGDWIIPFYYNIGISGFRSSLLCWVMLGGVLSLKRMASVRPAAKYPSSFMAIP